MSHDTTVRRFRRHVPRTFGWISSAAPITSVLARGDRGADVVFTVGPRPGGSIEGFHDWCRLPEGSAWSEAPRGHYLEAMGRPVLHYVRADGRRLEVHRAASWFGEGDYTPAQASDALGLLRREIHSRFDEDAAILTTPATTGRDLFLRTIPYDSPGFPVLDAETRSLIRETSTQGRWEILTADRRDEVLPGLYGYDARFGYAGCLWNLPVGLESHDDRPEFVDYAPARYRVTFTVPTTWDHVGLLPVRTDLRWIYPSEPGSTWTTWADGAELLNAKREGWSFDVHERLMFGTGKPLDGWARRITDVRDRLAALYGRDDVDPVALKMAAGAARMMLLAAVGSFHSAPHRVTGSCHVDDAAERVPEGARFLRVVGDQMTWTEEQPTAWTETSHPEWSAAIYARQRTRLLRHHDTGALTVPGRSVVAFRQDAIYLDHDPAWPDTGRVGAFRLDSRVDRPVLAPTTPAELLEARK